MYRYSVDNAVTYTPDDFVLFRESPFAVWMERLTLENPNHGIPADVTTLIPTDSAERQDDIVDTLRAEGRNVVLVDWETDEPVRRAATLEAMRNGADFVVNGQLALGPLSGAANLLMRTSGYSDLGNYLYVPCDTQDKTTLQSAYRLCFHADLLHSLQGQLPPQMLIIRGDAEVLPLQTEDHIFYYQAVKKRFMNDMRDFRKHRMPDPAQSTHFGRWAECASEVMKQRALGDAAADTEAAEEPTPPQEEFQVAAGAVTACLDTPLVMVEEGVSGDAVAPLTAASPVAQTLAEQARSLQPGRYKISAPPGPTPNLAAAASSSGNTPAEAEHARGDSDTALQDLEFIGSGQLPILGGVGEVEAIIPAPSLPSPSLMESDTGIATAIAPAAAADDAITAVIATSTAVEVTTDCTLAAEADAGVETARGTLIDEGLPARDSDTVSVAPASALASVDHTPEAVRESRSPCLLPPDETTETEMVSVDDSQRKPHPLDSDGFNAPAPRSVVDMDSAPPASLVSAPLRRKETAEPKTAEPRKVAPATGGVLHDYPGGERRKTKPAAAFSDSLITNDGPEDG